MRIEHVTKPYSCNFIHADRRCTDSRAMQATAAGIACITHGKIYIFVPLTRKPYTGFITHNTQPYTNWYYGLLTGKHALITQKGAVVHNRHKALFGIDLSYNYQLGHWVSLSLSLSLSLSHSQQWITGSSCKCIQLFKVAQNSEGQAV